MILIIRGHIRESFETKDLYELVDKIYKLFPNLKIFIHTWNIFASNLSWREINVNNDIVNNKIIYDYFGNLSVCIKHIIIDDDTKIKLIGNTMGIIINTKMPIKAWKNYWYGKYKIINYIFKNFKYKDETIINMRFDILNNSNSFNELLITDFIKDNSKIILKKNMFLFNFERTGIDNIYLGTIKTMHKLISKFYNDLDNISKVYSVKNPEKLVYKINSILFDKINTSN